MPVACYDLLRNDCRDNWSNGLNGGLWGPNMMLELIFLNKDCEAGRNTLLAYYPKYPLLCEICAVAICDRGFSEERTIPQRARARVRQTWGFFMGVYSGTRRTGEGCGPFREKAEVFRKLLFVCSVV